MNNSNNKSMIDRFVDFAGKIASITYLSVLKDSFTSIIPMFILAGFGTMFNSVIFPLFAEGEVLTQLQTCNTLDNKIKLNISVLVVAVMIPYYLSKAKGYDNFIAAIIVSIGSYFSILPLSIDATVAGSEQVATVTGAVLFDNIGANGMFAGIIIGFLATEMLIKLSDIKALEINLGEGVPPTVSRNFTTLIPVVIVVSLFALVSSLLTVLFNTNLIELIATAVQAPLVNVGSNLFGFLLIFTSGNFLFSLGIHHSVINSSILQPIMLVNTNQNMAAASAGQEIPNILDETFRSVYGTIGGTGSTFALLIAIFLFSKYEPYKQIVKLGVGPGLFNINEPLIFGLPIVFNVPLMIPFVLAPILGTLIGYFFIWVGFAAPFTVYIPWTTPPLINSFLASGGQWQNVVVQLIIIVAQTLLYIPFLRIAERVAKRQAAETESEATVAEAN